MKKQRRWPLILASFLLAGSMTAGAQGQDALKFVTWSDEESYVRKVVDAYNALKGSEEIVLEIIPNSDHEDWINQYSDDYQADVIGLRGNTHLVQLQRQGYLLGIGDYIQNSDLDITAYGTMFNEILYENEYYALPARSTCWALYYNKDLFDQAGLAYPEQMTWEEYHALSAELGELSDEVWGGYYPPWNYLIMAIQQGYYLLDDDLSTVEDSIRFLKEIYEDGSNMPFDDIKDCGDDCRYDFQKGNIGMMINGEWLANMFLEDAANGSEVPEWGIAPLPVPDGVETGTTIGMYQFAAITSYCKEPERAFEFLKFLCGPQGALIYAKNAIIPGYSNQEIKEAYLQAVQTKSASVFFEAKRIQEQPMWYGYDQLMTLFEEDVCSYIEGDHSLKETMELFEEQRAQILG